LVAAIIFLLNIALTGPYGSGKSSIIKSFLKGYKRPVLQISLAAFLPEAPPEAGSFNGKVSRQEIERSILQQMLYGADSKRLPLSRFKRIQSPGRWSMLASLFMIIGVIACWHLFQKRDAIMTGAYFRPFDMTNWFNLPLILNAPDYDLQFRNFAGLTPDVINVIVNDWVAGDAKRADFRSVGEVDFVALFDRLRDLGYLPVDFRPELPTQDEVRAMLAPFQDHRGDSLRPLMRGEKHGDEED
jgi:hypothetical protein